MAVENTPLWYDGQHELAATSQAEFKKNLVEFLMVLQAAQFDRAVRSDRRKVNGVTEEWRAETAETCGLLPFTEKMSARLRDNPPKRDLENA